jgi:carotenoid cleavage dioxygenase
MAAPHLSLVDPRAHAHLSGRFAPVHHEVERVDLPVEGALPPDLTGAYLRNGPNPRFTPLGSYTFPLEGDGMLHGTWLEDGRARYRNRWVYTQGLLADMRAGRALFGGFMTPDAPGGDELGPDPDPGWPFKLDAFINVVRHGGRWLALEEGTPPYEVADDLATVGRHDFAGRLPAGMCAHPRVDPITGEMVVFRYDVEEPFLTWAVVGPDGRVARPPTPVATVDEGFMIHDFTITEHHVVLVVAPAVIDVAAMGTGASPLRWDADRPTRIAVIDRIDGATRWVEADPFFAWHYGNAFEHGDEIVLDFPWWSAFTLGAGEPVRGGFARAHLRPDDGTATVDVLDDRPSEFPRIDDRHTARPHRYVTTSRRSGRHELAAGEFDQLARHDMRTGATETWDADVVFGEVVFAPRDGAVDDLDGYYLTYATAPDASRSWLLVWDAGDFPADPVARVRMPQRVPHGLHGNWFPASSPAVPAFPDDGPGGRDRPDRPDRADRRGRPDRRG